MMGRPHRMFIDPDHTLNYDVLAMIQDYDVSNRGRI